MNNAKDEERKETVFSLRIPSSMYEEIRDRAKKNKRSINSEILIALAGGAS